MIVIYNYTYIIYNITNANTNANTNTNILPNTRKILYEHSKMATFRY